MPLLCNIAHITILPAGGCSPRRQLLRVVIAPSIGQLLMTGDPKVQPCRTAERGVPLMP
jgi:hypothetical protein